MYKLDAAALRKADILLTRDKASPRSWLVRAASRSAYSHAILYVGGYSFIDSDMNGVHSNNLQRLIVSRCSDVRVLRLSDPVTEDRLDAICDFARSQVGQPYAVREAVQAARSTPESDLSERQFCSRLVAQAYRSAGIPLSIDPDFCLPGDFVCLQGFRHIEDPCTRATAEEVDFAQDDDHPLHWQEAITNGINKAIHVHTGTRVATLEDWVQLALDRPDADEMIAGLLEEWGYLEMWRWDRDRCPYWYDLAAFRRKFSADERAEVAEGQLDGERDNIRRFRITLEALVQTEALYPRRTTSLLIQLYLHLIRLGRLRAGVLMAARDDLAPTRC